MADYLLEDQIQILIKTLDHIITSGNIQCNTLLRCLIILADKHNFEVSLGLFEKLLKQDLGSIGTQSEESWFFFKKGLVLFLMHAGKGPDQQKASKRVYNEWRDDLVKTELEKEYAGLKAWTESK